MIRKIICYAKAVPMFIRCGIWCPHIYEEVERHRGIVIANKYFRESNSFKHLNSEKVYQNATIVTYKCIHCGAVDKGWFNGSEEDIPTIG